MASLVVSGLVLGEGGDRLWRCGKALLWELACWPTRKAAWKIKRHYKHFDCAGIFSWLVINIIDLMIGVARGEETDFMGALTRRALATPTNPVEEVAQPVFKPEPIQGNQVPLDGNSAHCTKCPSRP